MRVDRYTRLMLTIIAGALLYLCALASGGAVFAQPDARAGLSLGRVKPTPVVVVGWGSVRMSDGEITAVTRRDPGGVVYTDPTLPMKIQDTPEQPISVKLAVTPQHPLPVGITTIKRAGDGDWEPIRSKVEPEPRRATPGGGGR